MLTPNQPSELRKLAFRREAKQSSIDAAKSEQLKILEQLRTSHAWLMSWLNRNKPKTPITDCHPASPWTSYLQQIADTETSLHPILEIAITKNVELPITGDDIKVSEITQDKQPNKRTPYQDEYDKISRIRRELIAQCQEHMRNYYHAQDPKCMPRVIRMALLSKMALAPLEQGKFFPGTGIDGIAGVLVEADSTLGDQIICE